MRCPSGLVISYTLILFFYEVFKFCVTYMNSLCTYLEEVNKVSDINDGHESGLLVREEDCILDFTTNEVK